MYITPYLAFNGNAAQALAHYEQAFGVKATMVAHYNQAPSDQGYKPPPGTENHIMHAALEFETAQLYLADHPPGEEATFGDSISVMVELESAEKVNNVFKVLAQGGKVQMEPQKVFWCECYSTLTDKFGVYWMIATKD